MREVVSVEADASQRVDGSTWLPAIFGGEVGPFVAYLAATGILESLILLTVNAHSESSLARAELTARSMAWLQHWFDHGFWKYAGLIVYSEDGRAVYTTHSGLNMWPAYALELVIRGVTGGVSYRAMAILNQCVIALSAALLGWWTMRLLRPRPEAFTLGLAAAVVFQTFPLNLMNAWFLNPQSVGILAILCFWLARDVATRSDGRTARVLVALSVATLTLACSTPIALFFIAAFVLAEWHLDTERVDWHFFARWIIVPALGALVLHALQIAWARWNVPQMEVVGGSGWSEILFRTGFDGSTEYYGDHWSLLWQRTMSTSYPGRRPEALLQWQGLFVAGIIATAVFIGRAAYVDTREWRRPVTFLITSLTAYALMVFVFSQGAAIHPDLYDVMLVYPLIVAAFALLPACLETMTKRTGLCVLLAVVAAICYTMIQLRTYAMSVPVAGS